MCRKKACLLTVFLVLCAILSCGCEKNKENDKQKLPWELSHRYNFFLEDGKDFRPILFEDQLYSTDEEGFLYVYDAETRECIKLCETFFLGRFGDFERARTEVEEYLIDAAGNLVKWTPEEIKTLYQSTEVIGYFHVLGREWYFMDGSLLMKMNPETEEISVLCSDLEAEERDAGVFCMYTRDETPDTIYLEMPVGDFANCYVFHISSGTKEYLGALSDAYWWLDYIESADAKN